MFTKRGPNRPLLGILGAGVFVGSLLTMAVPATAARLADPCEIGLVLNNSQCSLAPGESIVMVLKGGNGGAGGAGGAGGVGGAGWNGSAVVPGGALGVGGAGGASGAGAKSQYSYVNNTGSTVTFTFVFGTNGAAGSAGSNGANGTASATTASVPANGGTGVSGGGGFGGLGGVRTVVQIGLSEIAVALGGAGGAGGVGGSGGEGGQGSGTLGRPGPNGAAGAAGVSGVGNLPTTNIEAPYIELLSSLISMDDINNDPPMWFQSYGLDTEQKCATGWASSWAQWVGGGRGGGVCNRYILWRNGDWVQTVDLELGPFLPWDGK